MINGGERKGEERKPQVINTPSRTHTVSNFVAVRFILNDLFEEIMS